MSSGGNDTPIDFNGDNDRDGGLRDPVLRRALDHAPDSEATPDPRTRDAIRKMAHNLAATPVSAAGSAANSASAAPWWRRLLSGGGEPRSRMPWNAAFATVLVATFVTVLWHREPIPDAQLDGEARVGGAAAPAQAPASAPVQPPAEAAPQASPPAVAAVPEPASAPEVADQQAPAAASARDEAPRDSRSKESVAANMADVARKPAAAPQASAKQAPRAPENDQKKVDATAQAPAAPVLAAPAPPAPAPAPITPSAPPAIVAEAPAAASDERREKNVDIERRRAYSGGAPAAPMAAPAPVAPAAPAASVAPPPTIELERSPPPSPALAAPPRSALAARRETQDNNTASLAGQANADQANAEATGALRQAAPRAAAKAVKPPSAAGFTALDRWTSLDLTRSGLGVRHARGDIEGLAALVGTVARSATFADEPLAAPVEARLALYRGDALIAVLEIAGDQVRWTPQPGGTATVGTPPAQALAALRSLLTR